MGGEGDSNHLVSGGDLEGDSDFTQPRREALPSSYLSCTTVVESLPK